MPGKRESQSVAIGRCFTVALEDERASLEAEKKTLRGPVMEERQPSPSEQKFQSKAPADALLLHLILSLFSMPARRSRLLDHGRPRLL